MNKPEEEGSVYLQAKFKNARAMLLAEMHE